MHHSIRISAFIFAFCLLPFAFCLALPPAACQAPNAVQAITFPRAFFPNVNNNLAVDTSGNVGFAPSFETDSLFAFSLTTGEKLGEITVGDGPSQVIVQGTLAATLNNAFLGLPRPTISILDVSDPRNLRLLATGTFPEKRFASYSAETLTFSRDGQWVFACATDKKGHGTLYAFESQNGTLVGQLPVGDIPAQLTLRERDGRRLLAVTSAPNEAGSVYFVDATDPHALRQQSQLTFPAASRLSLSNTVLLSETDNLGYVALPDQKQLVTFRVEPLGILTQTTVGRFPTRLLRTGNRLLVQEEGGATVTTLDLTQPEKPKPIAQFQSLASSLYGPPVINSDGTTGYVLSPLEATIYAFDIETGAKRGSYTIADPEQVPFNFVFGNTAAGVRCAILVPSTRQVEVISVASSAGFQSVGEFSTPEGVAFDLKQVPLVTADGSRAFIASPLTNEILEIAPATGSIVSHLKTDAGPKSLSLYEGNGLKRLAVVTLGGASVNLFVSEHGGEWKPSGTVKLSGRYAYLLDFANVVFSLDGTIGFVTDLDASVYAFETGTGTVLTSLQVGQFPAGLSIYENSSGQRKLAVSAGSLGDQTLVTVLDASNPRELRAASTTTIDKETLFALDNAPMFNAAGSLLYLGASFSSELLTIDASRGKIVERTEGITGTQLIPFLQNGKTAYVTANLQNGKILVLEEDRLGGLRKSLKINPPKDNFFLVSNQPVISDDGKQGFVASYGLGVILAFSTQEDRILNRLSVPGAPGRTVLVPNSNTLLTVEVNGNANRIFRVDTN